MLYEQLYFYTFIVVIHLNKLGRKGEREDLQIINQQRNPPNVCYSKIDGFHYPDSPLTINNLKNFKL